MIYIFGYGEMAKAIASSLNEEFSVVGRDKEKLEAFSKEFNCPYFLIDNFDISDKKILLAIKPYALQEVSMRIKGEAEVLISILAGKSIYELSRYIKSKYYLRAMPNVAAKYRASATALTGDENVKEYAISLFSQIGDVIWVENDDAIDMATAIIGSGPAFLALIAEAIADAGVFNGLKRDVSIQLTKSLFKSFSAIDDNFSLLKDKVMSPKGTTAAGIFELEKEGVRGKIMQSIIKSYEKSKKI